MTPELLPAAWNALSPAQQELMKKLGVGKAKGKLKRPAPIPTNLDEVKYTKTLYPYILCIINTCLLCRQRSYQLYEMRTTKKGLQSTFCFEEAKTLTRIPFDHQKKADKISGRDVTTCRYCRERLGELEKSEIIEKLLLARR